MRKYLDIINGSAETITPPKTNMLARYVDIIAEGYTAGTIHGLKVDEFVRGYIEAMLWSTTDESDEAGGDALNTNYSSDDLSHEAMDQIEANCRSFLHQVGVYITPDNFKGANLSSLEAAAGHDFWLTRAGHGTGFWDGRWASEDNGVDGPLTKTSKAFGNIDPYLGDDSKIHLM